MPPLAGRRRSAPGSTSWPVLGGRLSIRMSPRALWIMAANVCRDAFPEGEIDEGPPVPQILRGMTVTRVDTARLAVELGTRGNG